MRHAGGDEDHGEGSQGPRHVPSSSSCCCHEESSWEVEQVEGSLIRLLPEGTTQQFRNFLRVFLFPKSIFPLSCIPEHMSGKLIVKQA